jgi:hypothetical protein
MGEMRNAFETLVGNDMAKILWDTLVWMGWHC